MLQNTGQAVPLENREIRGLTTKQLVLFFLFFTSVVGTAVFMYSEKTKDTVYAIESLRKDIEGLTNQNTRSYADLTAAMELGKKRIVALETEVNLQAIRMLTLRVTLMNKGIISPQPYDP